MHCFGCQDHAYILLSKDSTTYANVVPHMQSIRNKHKHSSCIPSQEIWSMIWTVFWHDSSEIRAQLYCWEERLDLCFFYGDIKDAVRWSKARSALSLWDEGVGNQWLSAELHCLFCWLGLWLIVSVQVCACLIEEMFSKCWLCRSGCSN